ncbi:MAG: hypothetical protein RR777_07415 [Christensenellaceae bacterium]
MMKVNGVLLEELDNYLKKVDDENLKNWNKIIEERLSVTENSLERNELALILADHWGDIAVEPIIRLLRDKKTEGNRGTLLYALEDLNYSKYLGLLVDLMVQGNFEVSREAFSLIEEAVENHENDIVLEEDNITKQKNELMQKIKYLSGEIEFYIDALELLTNKLNRE